MCFFKKYLLLYLVSNWLGDHSLSRISDYMPFPMLLANILGPIFYFFLFFHILFLNPPLWFFSELPSNMGDQNKACPFTPIHLTSIFSSKMFLTIQTSKLLSRSYSQKKLSWRLGTVLGAVPGGCPWGEEEINEPGFLLSRSLVGRLTSQWFQYLVRSSVTEVCAWIRILNSVWVGNGQGKSPRRDNIFLGWIPSKQSLRGEILDKWFIEGDQKRPVRKWGSTAQGKQLGEDVVSAKV